MRTGLLHQFQELDSDGGRAAILNIIDHMDKVISKFVAEISDEEQVAEEEGFEAATETNSSVSDDSQRTVSDVSSTT